MKKIISLLLVCAFALSSLTACGGPENRPGQEVKPTEAPSATVEPTSTPESTPESSSTPAPTDTPESSASPAPAETQKPSETEKPAENQKPGVKPTSEPKPTATPGSNKPKPTEKPSVKPSEKPNPTPTPEHTLGPAIWKMVGTLKSVDKTSGDIVVKDRTGRQESFCLDTKKYDMDKYAKHIGKDIEVTEIADGKVVSVIEVLPEYLLSAKPSPTPTPKPTPVPTPEPTPEPEETWNLAFEDNFDFFDRSKWRVSVFRHGIRRNGFYVDDGQNVFTENGNLIIRTNYRDGEMGEGWYSGFLDTSIESSHHHGSYDPNIYKGFTMNKGYIECRCKVPVAEGIWSAFWMFPDQNHCFGDNDRPYDGSDGAEIDIMESLWAHRSTPEKRNRYKSTVHIDGYETPRIKSFSSPYVNVDMYSDFHTYGMLWEDDKYTFFLDGQKTWETTLEKDGKVCGTSRVPEFIILSTEVQGTIKDGVHYPGMIAQGGEMVPAWNGNPDNNDKTKNYDMVVDYVRCYTKG